jgi:hypothetical protein
MKNILIAIMMGCCALILAACDSATPEQTFGRAVLNSNMLYGFAGRALHQQFASPSVKLTDQKTGATAPMTRAEVLKGKVDAISANYEKVKSLKSDDDTRAMIAASRALYEFVLPVYGNEYKELAALYDSNAGSDKIAALEKTISEKYQARFQALHGELIAAGKAYAARHNIKVREVNPSPRR